MKVIAFRRYRLILITFSVIACLVGPVSSAMAQFCPTAGVKVWSPAGPALPAAVVGQTYTTTVSVSCVGLCAVFSNYIKVTGVMPPGLDISLTGLISGTPTAAGTYTFDIQATEHCAPYPPGQANSHTYSITVASTNVSGSVSPSSYSAPNTVTTFQGVTYTFTAAGGTSMTLTSPQGAFQVGGTTIGTNPTPLSASVVNGRGSVSEQITILPSVVQSALSLGFSRMTYTRTFTSGAVTVTTNITINITSESGASLLITRMQLYFQNRMPVITVKRNDPTLKAYVDITYVGSGFLQGYWEVDGNLLTNVRQMITTGRTVTIESPSPPILSTFIPGDHQIRFVVTSPFQSISFPQISYYVTPEESAASRLARLSLVAPGDQGLVDYEPTTFSWNRSEGVSVYFIQFFLRGEDKPVFSAYAKNPTYRLPDSALKAFFLRGKTYSWKVTGLDSSNTAAAESSVFTFSIRE